MKQLLTLLLVISTTLVFAQTSQGDWQVGGDVELSFLSQKQDVGGTSTDVGTENSISLSPRVGKFVVDAIAVGIFLQVSNSKFEDDSGNFVDKFNSLVFGPYVRYYTDGGFFGHAAFGFGSATNTFESGGSESETKFNITRWEVGPGYAFFISESVAFEGLLVYGSTTQKLKDSDPESKDILSGVTFRIGCFVFLN